MSQESPLTGIILSVVDERGPHPRMWYPKSFGNIAQIHNAAVKSFAIMIGDRSYRDKSPSDLTCFGILPYQDMDSIGFIYFSGFEDPIERKPLPTQRPATITLIFKKSYRDEVCQKSPQINNLLDREAKTLWEFLQKGETNSKLLSELYNKLIAFLEIK